MECNKEEAKRAKEIAEKRLCLQDYAGAMEMALKAEKLFPQLDNISQLLTVCEVHCAAQLMANGLQDWYKIIQVEPLSDEILIRKQYRKLVLLLHPDKNKFPGSKTAFQLVGEAKNTLSDRAKRIMYDLKRQHLVRSADPEESTETNSAHNSSSKFNRANKWRPQQQPQLQPHQGFTFWSACPGCWTRHHDYHHMLSKKVCCTNCSRNFIAKALPHLNLGHIYGARKQSRHFTGQQPPQMSGSYRFTCDRVVRETTKDNTEGVRKPNSKPNPPSTSNSCEPNTIAGQRRVKRVSVDTSKNPNSCSKPNLNLDFNQIRDDGGGTDSGFHAGDASTPLWRSPRNKPDVKYNGTEIRCSSPSKKARVDVKGPDGNGSTNATNANTNASNHVEREVKEQDRETEKEQVEPSGLPKEKETAFKPSESAGDKGAASRAANVGTSTIRCESSMQNADAGFLYEYPDAKFHDFHMRRTWNNFKQGHIWALYSDLDTLPKYYGLICKVEHYPFKVHISWLEACPKSQVERAWLDASFPISCGKFRVTTQNTIYDKPEYFSHMVSVRQDVRGSYCDILPEVSEIWAIYKKWSPRWTRHDFKTCKFEIVEIIEQREESTIVWPLRQVPEYSSVFMPDKVDGAGSGTWEVSESEYILFSHKIPAIHLTEECGGKLKGFWELDPASVPYVYFYHEK